MPLRVEPFLREAVTEKASDVHLICGLPPIFRINGNLVRKDLPPLKQEDIVAIIQGSLTETQRQRFEREREIDVALVITDGTRFRVNCHYERGVPGLAARTVPQEIPTLAEIQMPPSVDERLLAIGPGLILVTGPTGAGKSTSLAAMIRAINEREAAHIITLEDPIEFLHENIQSIIRQREYGSDFLSFAAALRSVLRQDPNVILVGEMRDLETIAATLTLAETGHLVLATLHTPNSAQTIDRVVDVFPPYQQPQIRSQLSLALRAIVAQRLIPSAAHGRVAVREVMINTSAVGHIIRENRIVELPTVLQTSAELGMVTFDRDLLRLMEEGWITEEEATPYLENARVFISRKR